MKIILIFSILTTEGFFAGSIVQPDYVTMDKCKIKAMDMRDNWSHSGISTGNVYVACKYK